MADLSIAVSISDGDGPTVVLCHGNSSARRSFRAQFEGATGERLQLIAFDWPGHGESSRATDPERTYTLPRYADVLVSLARELDARAAVFVGWSLGGHAILEAADRLPDALGFLIFGTPPVPCPPAAEAFLPHSALGVAFKGECTDDEAEALLAAYVRPNSPVPEWSREAFRATDPRFRESLAASLGPGGYHDEVAIVAQLSAPLAVLHGEHDQLVNRDYIANLAMPTLWRSSIQEIPGAGHTPHWENPEQFDSLLTAFVSDCTR